MLGVLLRAQQLIFISLLSLQSSQVAAVLPPVLQCLEDCLILITAYSFPHSRLQITYYQNVGLLLQLSITPFIPRLDLSSWTVHSFKT